MAPEVLAAVEQWRPAECSAGDAAALEPLLALVRRWVLAAVPPTEVMARRWMRAAAGLALWASRHLGSTDAETVLAPANVEHYTMVVCAERPVGWRSLTRWSLRVVASAANPAGWPPPTQHIGRRDAPAPYSAGEEAVYRLAVTLGPRRWDARRVWVVCGALGAGLRGPDLAVAEREDLVALAGGRVAVRVRGSHCRLVPIRADYTALARYLRDTSPRGRIVTSTSRNAVHGLLEGLGSADRGGLSTRRSRATWLRAHLVAGTPLGALRRIAGPLSANTLDVLIADIAVAVTDEVAVAEGLGA